VLILRDEVAQHDGDADEQDPAESPCLLYRIWSDDVGHNHNDGLESGKESERQTCADDEVVLSHAAVVGKADNQNRAPGDELLVAEHQAIILHQLSSWRPTKLAVRCKGLSGNFKMRWSRRVSSVSGAGWSTNKKTTTAMTKLNQTVMRYERIT
jgi:hypothetical protein